EQAEVTRSLGADAQLMQEYLQSQGVLVSSGDDGVNQLAAFQNVEGQTEAVVIGLDGNLYHAAREPLSDSGWNIYGVGSGFQQIAAVDAATVWGRGNDGVLWQNHHGRWT